MTYTLSIILLIGIVTKLGLPSSLYFLANLVNRTKLTGFLQVFLHVYEGVGRKIQPTRHKTKCTHGRASFRPQEGLTDHYGPQNHQIDRNHRSLDILTVFVPVGYFPCCCKPLEIVTIN